MGHNTRDILNQISALAEKRSCGKLNRLMNDYEETLIQKLTGNEAEATPELAALSDSKKHKGKKRHHAR